MKTPLKFKQLAYTIILAALCILPFSSEASAAKTVFVSILPQKYFVDKIAGDLADVNVLVMPGDNPHMYEPTPQQMTKLSKADVFLAIGVEFEEAWLPRLKSANKSMKVVHAEEGIVKIPMVAHEEEHDEHHDEHGHEDKKHDDHGHKAKAHEEHGHDEDHHEDDHGHEKDTHDDHGHEAKAHEEDHDEHAHENEAHDEHEHGTLDPHVWLSPSGARIIAKNTAMAMSSIDPANASVYEANLAKFLQEIDETDAQLKAAFAELDKKHRAFLVFHPSWGYLAHEYGLEQLSIESEGNEPSPKGLVNIVKQARELGIDVIFVQPQFSQKSAKVIATELNAQVVQLDPLAENWRENMIEVAKAFKESAH